MCEDVLTYEDEVEEYRNKLLSSITEEEVIAFMKDFNDSHKYFRINFKGAIFLLIAKKEKEVYDHFNKRRD